MSESKLLTFNFVSKKARRKIKSFKSNKNSDKIIFNIKTYSCSNFQVQCFKERKYDALPWYNNIQMLFHQDKIVDKLANSEDAFEDGGVTLDDDYHHVYCRDNIVSICNFTCLLEPTFTFIIQIIK